MKFSNFNNYNFKNKKLIERKVYNLIKKKLKASIFAYLNFSIFKKIYFNKINHKFIFLNLVDKNINCLITYLPEKNEKILKKSLIIFLLKNPFILIIYFINLVNLFKDIKPPENYLQVLHLINCNLININKKKKYSYINNLHKKILNRRYKGVYVVFKNSNVYARSYYLKNNFKIYKKNIFFTLAIKSLIKTKK